MRTRYVKGSVAIWYAIDARSHGLRDDSTAEILAYVHSTPFGWIACCENDSDGLYTTYEAALSAAEEMIK